MADKDITGVPNFVGGYTIDGGSTVTSLETATNTVTGLVKKNKRIDLLRLTSNTDVKSSASGTLFNTTNVVSGRIYQLNYRFLINASNANTFMDFLFRDGNNVATVFLTAQMQNPNGATPGPFEVSGTFHYTAGANELTVTYSNDFNADPNQNIFGNTGASTNTWMEVIEMNNIEL